MSIRALRLILGDQLSIQLASLRDCDKKNDVIFMCEVKSEASYVKHHKKKIAFIFSAMRHFAQTLKNDNFVVNYIRLDDQLNTQSLSSELIRAVKQYHPEKIILTEAAEWRVLEMMYLWKKELSIPIEIRQDDRFLCSRDEFKQWMSGNKK